MFYVSVPAKLPSVSTSVLNTTSIRVQWGSLPCDNQNGDITGYDVTWGKKTLYITGENTLMHTVVGLNASATYIFKVAAVNIAGTGPFITLTATTLGMSVMPLFCVDITLHNI